MILDEFQQQAAYQNNLYSLIIAGAGTGKTQTLIGRIDYLIKKQKLTSQEILVISYTNETVKDFSYKIKNQLNISVTVLTFHKLAMYILDLVNYSYILVNDKMLDYISQEYLFFYCKQNNFLKKFVLDYLTFFKFRSFDCLADNGTLANLKQELIQCVKLCNAKGYGCNDFKKIYYKTNGKNKSFFALCFFLLHLYINEKNSQQFLDFDDLINQASTMIQNVQFFPYRHILIDEFQDSSLSRIKLFKNLVEQFNLQFTVVGDDCQSIYKFSGTETNCFSILESFFPSLKKYYLKYTYRNSQELINLANAFVSKNPFQMKKNIYSLKNCQYPITFLYYKNTNKINDILRYVLNNYPGNILFLGRNSFDWKYYFKQEEILWIDDKHFSLKQFPNKFFTFLTVHQAKGLEEKNVVLLHASNSIYGFPNKLTYKKWFFYVSSKDLFPYEEERRLFYVAMTRAQEHLFILIPLYNPSSFTLELLKLGKKNIKIKKF